MWSSFSTSMSSRGASRAATTCLRSIWRWSRFPATEIANWDRGYGDFALVPDLGTLRRIPWLEATALVLCDVAWHDGSPVAPSPRQILKQQIERAAVLGYTPMLASELEFYLFRETYAQAHEQGYRDLTPSVPYILDSPHPRVDLRRAVHPPGPQRHARRGDSGRDLEGRGVAGPARDQFPLFRRPDDGRQPHDLQERGQGDRLSKRLRGHVHGKTRSHVDRKLVPHPREPLARRGQRLCRRVHRLRGISRRADRVLQGARGLPGAHSQLLQALRRRELGADNACLGPRQPDVRLPDRRARRVTSHGDANPGRRRESVSRVRGSACRRALRYRAPASSAGRPRGKRLRVRRRTVPSFAV